MKRRRGLWLVPLAVGACVALAGSPDPAFDQLASRPSLSSGLGLPPAAVQDPALVALGRKLFMDRRLSANGTMSCGMCHVPEQGFAANELATAVGIEGHSLRRNAPTVLNVGFQEALFHDGRERRLENQIWAPLLAGDEMGNASKDVVLARVRELADYAPLLERVLAGQDLTTQTLEAALAAYQRTLVSGGSRFDRRFYAREVGALSAQEQQGFELFRSKARCAACHRFEIDSALFTDHQFHNTGVGWARQQPAARVRVPLAPGVETEIPFALIESLVTPLAPDHGRFEVTGREPDRLAYRTPTLRNIALTAPYMHDGSIATLEGVIEFYDRGGIDNPGKEPFLRRLGLSGEEKQALAAFLRALTGENVGQLASEARAAASTPDFPGARGGAPAAR